MRTETVLRGAYGRRMTNDTAIDWIRELDNQLSWHWQHQLRPRLEGLSDDEYFWEPVNGCWNIRRRQDGAPGAGAWTADWASPEPAVPPVTTIGWRLAHLIVGVFGARNAAHFRGPAVDYFTHEYAGDAATALAQLDEAYDRWITGVRGMTPDRLASPVGEAEGEWASHPYVELVLHINREVLHHGAEIALLRDLYRSRPLTG